MRHLIAILFLAQSAVASDFVFFCSARGGQDRVDEALRSGCEVVNWDNADDRRDWFWLHGDGPGLRPQFLPGLMYTDSRAQIPVTPGRSIAETEAALLVADHMARPEHAALEASLNGRGQKDAVKSMTPSGNGQVQDRLQALEAAVKFLIQESAARAESAEKRGGP